MSSILLGRDFPGMRGTRTPRTDSPPYMGTDDESYPGAALCSERIDRLRVSVPSVNNARMEGCRAGQSRPSQHYHCRHARNSLGSKAGKNYDYRSGHEVVRRTRRFNHYHV
jgi:hypothetical protein